MAKKVTSMFSRSRHKFHRPEGAANLDNMDDYNIVDSFNVNTGYVRVLTISGAYTFPGDDGSNQQVLQTDGAGNVSWGTVSVAGDNLGNHVATQTISGSDIVMTGDISGATIHGDGSGLTGVTSTEVDPDWGSQSGAYLKIADEAWPSQSGAYLKTADEADPIFGALSGAYIQTTLFDDLSGAHFTLSGAVSANITDIAANASTIDTVSGAYLGHAADSSDPHGALLTQTGIIGTTMTGGHMVRTSDFEVLSGAYIANIVYGTAATPEAASDYPRGTIYVQYTP